MDLAYLDNAASEPLRPEALTAMNEAAACLLYTSDAADETLWV